MNIDTSSIDTEWTNFLLQQNDSPVEYYKKPVIPLYDDNYTATDAPIPVVENDGSGLGQAPDCDDLYISTKTKVLYFNTPIDIHSVFWKIPVIENWRPEEGVIKKQIKVSSKTVEEYNEYKEKIRDIPYYVVNIIKQIDNPESRRIKFKDERKITVGLSKKDIINSRGKVKNAFYNCFALIFRILYNGEFREIHVKIFNTGKLEIPGILNTEILDIVKQKILQLIIPLLPQVDNLLPQVDNLLPQVDNLLPQVDPFIERVSIVSELYFIEPKNDDNILINSNFSCNFYINREKIFNILRSKKYGIECSYDPCSYPGVKCKYYFNNTIGLVQNGQILNTDRAMKMCELKENKKYTEISFMIFRTGSCLIVGNCSERILMFVFAFIKKVLNDEYPNIRVSSETPLNKKKNKKLIKKTVTMTNDYYEAIKL